MRKVNKITKQLLYETIDNEKLVSLVRLAVIKEGSKTIKKLKKVLSSLLQDFEEEISDSFEWTFGDDGSWTNNIKAARKLLK